MTRSGMIATKTGDQLLETWFEVQETEDWE